jgi:hypothetical protein
MTERTLQKFNSVSDSTNGIEASNPLLLISKLGSLFKRSSDERMFREDFLGESKILTNSNYTSNS